MGIYVNPGNKEFRLAVNDDIYIDKTELIRHTNDRLGKASRYLCVSRPRRFGKSMAADMLCAYYSRGCDSSGLFAGRRIEEERSYTQHLNQHNVIRLDVQQFLTSDEDTRTFLEDIRAEVLRELMESFPACRGLREDMKLSMVLNRIYACTGTGFVFIIDEWDCVFRMAKERTDVQKGYLDFLRGLFKGAVYVDLVYMTGILPIKKYGEHSAVNMFEEYSMTAPGRLSTYYGFTEEEVREECREYGADFGEISKWYDGYLLEDQHIYNPKSVVDALRRGKVLSYWTGTETYEALKIYIEQNYDGLKEAVVEMLGGGACEVDTASFQNDMTTFHSRDDVLTLLVHLGYLTYDSTTREVSIPNLEVSQEFVRAIRNGSRWDGLMQSLQRSAQLLEDTWRMDGEAVAAGIEEIHSETASMLKYNDENSLTCVLYMAYYSALSYYAKPVAEFPTGKGYADLVYLPLWHVEKPALIVELKWNRTAEGAIRQIREKRYPQWMEDYAGDVLLIGINYDKAQKKHTCIIEKGAREK